MWSFNNLLYIIFNIYNNAQLFLAQGREEGPGGTGGVVKAIIDALDPNYITCPPPKKLAIYLDLNFDPDPTIRIMFLCWVQKKAGKGDELPTS